MSIHSLRLRASCSLAALTLAGAALAGPAGANDAAPAAARSAPALPGAPHGRVVATDARGPAIPAMLASKGRRIRFAGNDFDTVNLLAVDPTVWLEQKVVASDGRAYDDFGTAIAVSGKTALVGVPGRGIVYAFRRVNGNWTATQEFMASDGADGDGFGYAIAVDGRIAVIGAPGATIDGQQYVGAAYVFSYSGGLWSEQKKLVASDGTLSVGMSVALDGQTVVLGGYYGAYPVEGAAWVFQRSNGVWGEVQKLTANDEVDDDGFASSLAVAGSTVLIGAYCGGEIDYLCQGPGAVYVFTGSGGDWLQTQKLIANDAWTGGQFGWVVAASGATVLIGAPFTPAEGGDSIGAGYIFSDSGGTWSQTQELVPTRAGHFGISVALDGNRAVVGSGSDEGIGTAAVFEKTNGSWMQTRTLSPSDGGPYDWFSWSVAASDNTVLVGAPDASTGSNYYQGAAYFYGKSDLDLAESAPATVSPGETFVSQTIATNNASAASPAVSATIAVPAGASFVSAAASQGHCQENAGMVRCRFGAIEGNAGTAIANLTLKATGEPGTTIEQSASVEKATPPLTAGAATRISEGGVCPEGYGEYDGSLNAGKLARSPSYQAPAGQENATLTGPEGFRLFAAFQNAEGRKIHRIPGNEIHRSGPAGTYAWIVKAGDGGGSYTLCLLHP